MKRKISLAARQERFATMSRNMAKTISEVFLKSVKVDLEISYDKEIQEEDILKNREAPAK